VQVVVANEARDTSQNACNSMSPGPGCPCSPEEGAKEGACSAGFICTALWSAMLVQPAPAPNATAKCWPCAFGQYCPAGSYLSGQSADLPQAVENHTCRYTGINIAEWELSIDCQCYLMLSVWMWLPAVLGITVRPPVSCCHVRQEVSVLR